MISIPRATLLKNGYIILAINACRSSFIIQEIIHTEEEEGEEEEVFFVVQLLNENMLVNNLPINSSYNCISDIFLLKLNYY
jgi:hypothetical protein